jgi:hypothetical protein
MAATFFEITLRKLATRGILLVVCLASLLSIRRVLVLEPAAVFRG